jgi:hypothetical protein
VALRAFSFFLAVDQRFEMMITLFADVLENWHGQLQVESLLESIYGEFANLRLFRRNRRGRRFRAVMGEPTAFSPAPLAERRARADHRQLSAAEKD